MKDLEPGQGEERVRFRTAVLVNYTGWVYDGCKGDLKGEMFDTSSTRGIPISFMVGAGRVIKGWDEGLVGMKEGGKRLLVIPPDKAYGASLAHAEDPAQLDAGVRGRASSRSSQQAQ